MSEHGVTGPFTASQQAREEPAKKTEGWIEFSLPESGRKARRMAKPKGIHMKQATAVAAGDKDAIGYALAHITCVVETEAGSGQFAKLALEDILELDLADTAKLVGEAADPLGEKPKPAKAELEAMIEKGLTAAIALDKLEAASSASSPTST